MCRGKAEHLALNDKNMVILLLLVLSLVSIQMHEKNGPIVNVFLCSLDMTTYMQDMPTYTYFCLLTPSNCNNML